MRPPIALSIAGTDPSGGAGIHADLKTFTALGAYGTTVITALVAQNTHGVSRVLEIDEGFVADQFASVLDDMPVDATKTGMLGTRGLVELVCDEARDRDLGFLVVDPVMVATSGHRLLAEDAVDAVRTRLVPAADLITPNLPEAALLLGPDVPEAADPAGMRGQARELVARGASAVLLKGGHLESGDLVDVLAVRAGDDIEVTERTRRRIATPHTHGTGCTLSAAITAHIAATRLEAAEAGADDAAARLEAAHAGPADVAGDVRSAVDAGLDFLARAIASGAEWELSLDPAGAHGPVDHLVDIRTGARLGPS